MAVLATAVFAGDDCKKGTFVGSYTRQSLNVDVLGDGSVTHSFLFQLTLSADGSAREYWTGFPDYFLTAGTGTGWIGSWTCRADGKLVLNMIGGNYFPGQGFDLSGNPITDTILVGHSRITSLFTVTDSNTLTRIQTRTRNYQANQDPTDPAGGTLRPLTTTNTVYTRLVASDADLNQ
jgi:hypothetical protein